MSYKADINTDTILRRFENMEYEKLNDVFRNSISESLAILKKATESNLKGTGVNVTAPIRKGGVNYPALIKGVISEVNSDGTEGRVRIAKAKAKGYIGESGDDYFALKWYEQGTQERLKKGKGYTWKANTNSKQGGARKHRNTGASTGKLKKYNFFANAYNSTWQQVNENMERSITKALQNIMEQ